MTPKYPRETFRLPKGPIEFQGLVFRPLGMSHEEAMWKILSDPDFTRHVPFDLATDREAQRKLYTEQINGGIRFRFHFAAEWQEPPSPGDFMPGFVMFRPTEDGKKVEIGYGVARQYWGQGLGGRLISFLVDEMTAKTGVKKRDLVAKIEPGNAASIRAAEKFGFRIRREVQYEGRPLLILHWFP